MHTIRLTKNSQFLPRDVTQSAVMPTVCRPSVCLTVRLKRLGALHTGWNTSKIIPRMNNLRFSLGLTPTWVIWSKGTPKIRVE